MDWSESFTPDVANTFHTHGAIPELAWEPKLGDAGVSYADVTNGKYDTYLDTFSSDVKKLSYPIRITLAPEMNSDWVPWGIGKNGNDNTGEIAFWRYVVNRFAANGVANVSWVWSPNVHYSGETYTYSQLFPGDAFVNYVGLDGYNWGTTQSWSVWQSFSDVFGSSYNDLISLSARKILITEVASAEQGGSKADWILAMGNDLRTKFTRIQGITWFDINKETDWRIDSSQASKQAFSNMVLGIVDSSSTSSGASATTVSPNKKKQPATVPSVVSTPQDNLNDETASPAHEAYITDQIKTNLVASDSTFETSPTVPIDQRALWAFIIFVSAVLLAVVARAVKYRYILPLATKKIIIKNTFHLDGIHIKRNHFDLALQLQHTRNHN